MEITLALLADAANLSQEGKLNILGAFTNINAAGFPARHPAMHLVLQFNASPSEASRSRHIEVRLLDEDGTALGTLEADFVIPDPDRPGGRIQIGSVLPLTDVVFQRAGEHMFDILIDGDSKKQLQLTITQIPEGGAS